LVRFMDRKTLMSINLQTPAYQLHREFPAFF